jgi:hypothetical protein
LTEDGEYKVLLDNGVQLRMSRRYSKELHSRLSGDDSRA